MPSTVACVSVRPHNPAGKSSNKWPFPKIPVGLTVPMQNSGGPGLVASPMRQKLKMISMFSEKRKIDVTLLKSRKPLLTQLFGFIESAATSLDKPLVWLLPSRTNPLSKVRLLCMHGLDGLSSCVGGTTPCCHSVPSLLRIVSRSIFSNCSCKRWSKCVCSATPCVSTWCLI